MLQVKAIVKDHLASTKEKSLYIVTRQLEKYCQILDFFNKIFLLISVQAKTAVFR